MPYAAINVEGGLFPAELLDDIAAGAAALPPKTVPAASFRQSSRCYGADGSPILFLRDKDGTARAALADGTPTLTLFDAKGGVLWQAPR